MDESEKKKKKSQSTVDYFSEAYANAAREGYLGAKAKISQEDRDKKKKKK